MQPPKISWPMVAIFACLVAGGVTVYYIRHQSIQNEKLMVEKAACLERAELTYSNTWDEKCYSLDLLPGCGLEDFYAKDLNDMRKEHKDDCYRFYSR